MSQTYGEDRLKMRAAKLFCAVAMMMAATHSANAELKFKPGEDPRFHWSDFDALRKVNLQGEELTIFGPWRAEDESLFTSVLAYFEEATGAKVKYSSGENYEQQIVIDTEAGSPANISILPQPGLWADLARKGRLAPLADSDAAFVRDNYGAGNSWVQIGSFADKDGVSKFFAFPYKADVKSLVWYSPENFRDAGYKPPQSMEELLALSEQIVKDGGKPWCIGLGSGGATGWPATDWVEDIILRTQSPSIYDKWVRNEIKFDDPAIVNALDIFGSIAKRDEFVDGGAAGVASIDFRDSPKGLFTTPPKCYMHRQASFIPSYFPEGTKLGPDADFFYFPAYAAKPKLGTPVLGAGTLVAITKDSPAARTFIEFLHMPLAHELWMAQSGFLTPLKLVNKETYGNETLRKQGEILTSATTFRFDGSDLMPGKIGAGAFWTAMVDFVSGKSATDAATAVQKAWDEIK